MTEDIIVLLFTLIFVPFAMTLLYSLHGDKIKGFSNKYKGALEDIHKLLTPKTPIQKEIEEKRKEIEQLKKQKADMEELDRLKIEESKLFWEVNDPEESTGPHFKWCAVCKNYYSGECCDCLDESKHEGFVWVPLHRDEMRLKRATYKMKDPHATYVEECPYCSAYSFEYEYVKDGMIQTCRNCQTEVGMIKANSPIKKTMK